MHDFLAELQDLIVSLLQHGVEFFHSILQLNFSLRRLFLKYKREERLFGYSSMYSKPSNQHSLIHFLTFDSLRLSIFFRMAAMVLEAVSLALSDDMLESRNLPSGQRA